jgi:hypothetical protein
VSGNGELVAAAKRSPEIARTWKSLLDVRDPAARDAATQVLMHLGVMDPRMIPFLVARCRSIDNTRSLDQEGRYLLRLHRAGHNVVPAVAARWRALRAETGALAEKRRVYTELLIQIGRDADGLAMEFRDCLRAGQDVYEACGFLSAVEKRRMAKAAQPGVAEDAVPPKAGRSFVPDFIDRLCSMRPGDVRDEGVRLVLNEHFDRAVPLLVEILRNGPAARRAAVLSYLAGGGYGNSPGHKPVTADMVKAVVDLLPDPATRWSAIAVLERFGPAAKVAIPDLLEQLDGSNVPHVCNAIRGIGSAEPSQAERLERARTRFARHADRAAVLAELKLRSANLSSDCFTAAIVLLALHESVDEMIVSLRKWSEGFRNDRSRQLLASLAAADPFLCEKLLDGGVYWAVDYRALRSERFVPVLLRQIERRSVVDSVAAALARICRDKTPKEVPGPLFGLLRDEGVSLHERVYVLEALADMAPVAGAGTVPEMLRNAAALPVRRLAAAAALRWNPGDKAARATLLEWAAAAPSDRYTTLYDRHALGALCSIAPTDPEARTALVGFLWRLGPQYGNSGSLTEKQLQILQYIQNCGKAGVDALAKRFAETGDEALAQGLRQLGANRKVELPAVFVEARRARQPFKSLWIITTDETAVDLLEVGLEQKVDLMQFQYWVNMRTESLLVAQERPPLPTTYSLRWPGILPRLKAWLKETNGPRADIAFGLLSHTNLEDPDVWKAVVSRAVDPSYARHWATEKALRRAGIKGVAVLCMQLDLPEAEIRSAAEQTLEALLNALPDAYVDALLADPNARIRKVAVRSLQSRLRREVTLESWDAFYTEALRQRDASQSGVIRRLGRVLAEDADEDVRTAAWWGIDYVAWNWPERAPVLFELLSGDQRAAWLRQAAALCPKEAGHAVESSPAQSNLVRWCELLDMRDTPALRPLLADLEKLLPAPQALPAKRQPAKELIDAFLITSQWGPMTRDAATERRKLRLELLARASNEPELADCLVREYFTGKPGNDLDRRVVATIRRLGPAALPALLKCLDLLDRPSGNDRIPTVCRGHLALIELFGDLGPQTKAALPLLLVHAGDPRSEWRIAARNAVERIAPELAAEIN